MTRSSVNDLQTMESLLEEETDRSYIRRSSQMSYDDPQSRQERQHQESRRHRSVLMNFVLMSLFFSANHSAMVSCLSISTLHLGSTGAWELALLQLIFASSALLGASWVVKRLGSLQGCILGMAFYSAYVGTFWFALRYQILVDSMAVLGAFMGGVGGSLVWVAQGCYFGQAAEEYASIHPLKISREEATATFGGIFAFVYLIEEVAGKLLSWILFEADSHATWNLVVSIYVVVAIVSTFCMLMIKSYPSTCDESSPNQPQRPWLHKLAAAVQLFQEDPKMKYMVGLNAAFGFAMPFVNSFVNGEVVHRVLLHDSNQRHVGLYSAFSAAVAATCSLAFGKFSEQKGLILMTGSACFSLVALPFLFQPDFSRWTSSMLGLVYGFQGVGRSTFEGTLRSVFADYFPDQKEASFANVVLQNGLFSSLGFMLSFYVPCLSPGPYCVEFNHGEGSHNMFLLELGVLLSGILAVIGYAKASELREAELLQGQDAGGQFRQSLIGEHGLSSPGGYDAEAAQRDDSFVERRYRFLPSHRRVLSEEIR